MSLTMPIDEFGNVRIRFLTISDLNGTVLGLANLEHAHVLYTTFADLDLSEVKGLDRLRHLGPSSIGIDTILRSKGKIPESFLRGAGVPQDFIEYAKRLLAHPFEYHSCFISYSAKDQAFVDRLYADLQNNRVHCWLATEDLKIGDKFRVTIDEAVRKHEKLLIVLSTNSVQSNWVEKEVETAMEKERDQKGILLFPIRLDDAVMQIKTGWPADVRRTRHIGDFSDWKKQKAYQKSFERLLQDLKKSQT